MRSSLVGVCFVLHSARLISSVDGSATVVRLAFGSCNRGEKDQTYWREIVDRHPDFWLWGGDIIYGDRLRPLRPLPLEASAGDATLVKGTTYSCLGGSAVCFTAATPQRLRTLYAEQKSAPGYQELRRRVSRVLGIWDDHDMGLNDGDSGYLWREESQQALLDFLDEPLDSPRRARAGVWDAFMTTGPSGRRIAVHLLDVRHNKDPYGTPGGDFLGEEQWTWLNESLRAARDEAAVNIVVSGLQVLRPWPRAGEVWGRFPDARARLLRTLAASGARGLVLLSGDVHMAQLNAVRCGDAVVHELTSSGLTHSLSDLGILASTLARLVLWVAPQNHLVGSTYTGRNFGELDISISDDGVPSIVGRIVSLHPGRRYGSVVLEHAFDALSGGRGASEAEPPPSCSPILGDEAGAAVAARLAVVVTALAAAFAVLLRACRRLCRRACGAPAKQHQA